MKRFAIFNGPVGAIKVVINFLKVIGHKRKIYLKLCNSHFDSYAILKLQ
jgi:hypothetical protein